MDMYAVMAVDNEEYSYVFAVYASSEEDAMKIVNEDNADRPLRPVATQAKQITVKQGEIQEVFNSWSD